MHFPGLRDMVLNAWGAEPLPEGTGHRPGQLGPSLGALPACSRAPSLVEDGTAVTLLWASAVQGGSWGPFREGA